MTYSTRRYDTSWYPPPHVTTLWDFPLSQNTTHRDISHLKTRQLKRFSTSSRESSWHSYSLYKKDRDILHLQTRHFATFSTSITTLRNILLLNTRLLVTMFTSEHNSSDYSLPQNTINRDILHLKKRHYAPQDTTFFTSRHDTSRQYPSQNTTLRDILLKTRLIETFSSLRHVSSRHSKPQDAILRVIRHL